MNYKDLIKNGIDLARNGKFIEAENNFKKAIEKDSNLTDSYINLANIYIIQKRIEESINLLNTYLINIFSILHYHVHKLVLRSIRYLYFKN